MHRRSFLLRGVSVVAIAAVGLPAKAAGGSFILYIGASDCPHCRRFMAYDFDNFSSRARQMGLAVRTLNVASFRDIRDEGYWPADLKPLLAQFSNKGGTPRFLMVRGGRVVENVFGGTGGKRMVGIPP